MTEKELGMLVYTIFGFGLCLFVEWRRRRRKK